MVRKIITSRQVQFLAVGLAVMALGFPILYFLVEVTGLNPRDAKFLELAISIQLNYLGNRKFTWNDREIKSWWGGLFRFNMSRAATAALSWVIFVVANERLGIDYLVASAIGVVAAMVVNYLSCQLWVFRDVRSMPMVSMKRLVRQTCKLCGIAAVVAGSWLWLGPLGTAYLAIMVAIAVLTFVSASSLWLSLHAWHTPENMENAGFDTPQDPQHGFSIIWPVRNSSLKVMGPTLQALVSQSHPDFEIILVVPSDDPDPTTRQDAELLQSYFASQVRLVYVEGEKNKPRSLRAGFEACTKDIVGIFDAESIAAPDLLIHVDTKFVTSGADIVQAGVQLMNYNDSWYSLFNCLEYYRWFKSRLHWHAKDGFITLGGNTVFFRRSALEAVGGWDIFNLTEDAEIGVRMSVAGFKTVVAYDPKLVTREETPDSIKRLLIQRRRWMQGFLQTYSKGVWRRLPLRHRLIARYMLMMPHFQALCGLLIPASVAMAMWVKLPTLLAMATFVPAVPTVVTLVADLVALREFGSDFGLKIKLRHKLKLVLGTLPYQWLLSVSAVSAAYRWVRGVNVWDLTKHSGKHHTSQDALAIAREAA